jgi:hypothetical protein
MRDELSRVERLYLILPERTRPRHRRLAVGGGINSASSSESISFDHSIEGKAIEYLTGWDASTRELRSKDSRDERDRLKEIMGRSLLITGAAASFRIFSRAAVAGEQDLQAFPSNILFVLPSGVFGSSEC